MKKVKFKKGKYYIGDLCYAIDNESWGEFCIGMDYAHSYNDKTGKYYHNDVEYWFNSTAWGDGLFHGSNRKLYPVDAGLIGILPEELVETIGDGVLTEMDIEIFAEDFEVWYDKGVFHFGDIIIATN